MNGPGQQIPAAMEDRFNNISLFLKATQPDGYESYYNPRKPLLGKELSVGSIDKTDMLAHNLMVWNILELFCEGQIDYAWDRMTWFQSDWKASMSIEGKLLDSLTSQEYKYSQTQTLHEFQHPPKKRGLFGGKEPPQEVQR